MDSDRHHSIESDKKNHVQSPYIQENKASHRKEETDKKTPRISVSTARLPSLNKKHNASKQNYNFGETEEHHHPSTFFTN